MSCKPRKYISLGGSKSEYQTKKPPDLRNKESKLIPILLVAKIPFFFQRFERSASITHLNQTPILQANTAIAYSSEYRELFKMDKRHNITPQITDVVNAARAKKDEIAKTTPYGWNEYRRLHCLSLVSKYLGDGKQNPGQLLNVHAVIAAYKAAKGQADIKWKHWSVSYWAQGNQIKEDVFRWDDCLGRLSKANALQQSLWIESVCRLPLEDSTLTMFQADPAGPLPFRRFYGSPPSTPGSTFTIAVCSEGHSGRDPTDH
jgi:hypothetical protein